jgi:hypothetical protein
MILEYSAHSTFNDLTELTPRRELQASRTRRKKCYSSIRRRELHHRSKSFMLPFLCRKTERPRLCPFEGEGSNNPNRSVRNFDQKFLFLCAGQENRVINPNDHVRFGVQIALHIGICSHGSDKGVTSHFSLEH